VKVLGGVRTDEELVELIDEIKFKLKMGIPYSPLREDFNTLLNSFIEKWELNKEPHFFATLEKPSCLS
jgi:hypothetical protein